MDAGGVNALVLFVLIALFVIWKCGYLKRGSSPPPKKALEQMGSRFELNGDAARTAPSDRSKQRTTAGADVPSGTYGWSDDGYSGGYSGGRSGLGTSHGTEGGMSREGAPSVGTVN